MSNFTIISFFTPDFTHFAEDLKADCERFGYPHYIVEVNKAGSLIDTWDRKVEFIHDAINQLGTVLWLDVECRLLAPIPPEWTPPLISTFSMGNSNPVSSGVLLLDPSYLPLVKVWSRHARINTELPDDYVFDFLLSQYDLPFNFVKTDFFNRDTESQIVRGQWSTPSTIIQHPTINRWPNPLNYSLAFNGKALRADENEAAKRARKRKYIYWRNFGGDFEVIDELMTTDEDSVHELNNWVFHPATQQYAPVQYWKAQPEIFGVKPLTLAQFQKNTEKGFSKNPFRAKALNRMRLEPGEKKLYPIKEQPALGRLKTALGL